MTGVNLGEVLPQTLATLVVAFSMFLAGFDAGWSSSAIPDLRNGNGSTVNATEDELNWIISLNPIGAVLGTLLTAPSIAFFGRRGTMTVIAPFYIGCYLLVGLASNPAMIISGRFLLGVLGGTMVPAAQIYVSEISSAEIRGALSSLTGVFLTVGILVAYGFGSFLNWWQLTLFAISFPTLLVLGSILVPESPIWFLTKRKDEKARKALQTLRGKDTDINEEFEIKRCNAERLSQLPKVTFRSVKDPTFWKPLSISSMLMMFQQCCGYPAVAYNTASIFASTGSAFSPTISSVIVGAVMVSTTVAAMFLVDKAGRKILMLTSSVGMAVAQAGLGVFFYIQASESEEVVKSVSWLPLTSLIAFFICFAIGMNGIPFIIFGELFPVQYRGICSSLSGAANRLFSFIIVRTFPLLQITFGKHGCFWFYSSCCCACVVCIVLFVPETKGKSLEEIATIFEGHVKTEDIVGLENKGYADSEEINKTTC